MPSGFCRLALFRISESGIASIYSYKGGRTASGESSQPGGLTAAHRTLPFGTRVQVTNKRNGRTVVVTLDADAVGAVASSGGDRVGADQAARAVVGAHADREVLPGSGCGQ